MTTTPRLLDRLFRKVGILGPACSLRVHSKIVRAIVSYHLFALLACLPWLFNWASVGVCFAGIYVFGTLGINVCYHRLLTHRGFACPRWLEHALSVLGVCAYQGTPMKWVAIHRMHHQHSDDPEDPHSPRGGFFWAHMGWFMMYDPAMWNLSTYDRYGRDLIRDRFYKRMERPNAERRIQGAQWAVFFGLGALIGGLVDESWFGALQMGLSMLIWGVFVRTVLVWHITWSVNSVTHVWGYRNFATKDGSRNNILVGLIGAGEGWHNNHHAQPRSASHGMRWWELDISYLTIRALQMVGLAWNLVKPHKGIDEAPDEPQATIA